MKVFKTMAFSRIKSKIVVGTGTARIVKVTTLCALEPRIVPRGALGVLMGAISNEV